jgi:two-component system sensor histidine kinase/response regulator
VKFSERGEVIVRATKESETGSQAGIRFAVTDTGIGISETSQVRLFQAFVQADGSTTRKFWGSGLGLAISKQLVELMGGEIGMESVPGKGSTFWFTALFEKQPHVDKAVPVPNARLDGLRVLIVDDNATNRTILIHQTASWKMIPSEAEDGNRALELLRAAAQHEPYDIVLMDTHMPGITGFELARTMNGDPSIANGCGAERTKKPRPAYEHKLADSYRYLQIVHSVREGKKIRQQVLPLWGDSTSWKLADSWSA